MPWAPGAQLVFRLPDQLWPADAGAEHTTVSPFWVHCCQSPEAPVRVTPAGTVTFRVRPPASSRPEADTWKKGAALGPPTAITADSCPGEAVAGVVGGTVLGTDDGAVGSVTTVGGGLSEVGELEGAVVDLGGVVRVVGEVAVGGGTGDVGLMTGVVAVTTGSGAPTSEPR